MVSSQIREPVTKFFQPMIIFFAKLGIHPNVFTLVGLVLMVASGVFIALNNFLVAVILLWCGGLMDFLDGGVARYRGLATKQGGFLDSIVDRISDLAVFGGVALSNRVDIVTGLIMVTSTLLISYVRAKGESIGVQKMSVGLMERSERLLFLFLLLIISLFVPSFVGYEFFGYGAFTHGSYFTIGFYILTALCIMTVLQRFIYGLFSIIKSEQAEAVQDL